jgi:hypothetical protein
VDSEDTSAQEDGFQMLCRESVRFSHTYTPSPLSQPALVSLLTGLWPYEHGVRDNGASALSAHVVTTAEVAYAAGYRTSFFSGGAPIFRKSGLAQGFELFEDAVTPGPDKLSRTFGETVRLFKQWYLSDVNGKFFTVMYAPDLQVFDEPTLDEKGHVVERSYDGRMRRLRESFADLVEFLKKQNQWNSTYVILVGLNGYTDQERFNEIPATNLHSENTQVALLIKPPQKSRDLGLSWKIDANVALPDVARTLYEIFGFDPSPAKGGAFFPSFSLMPSLRAAEVSWPEDRLIPIESDWAEWREVGGLRMAFRSGSQLLLWDEAPKLYNTLTDRLELNPIKPGPQWDERIAKAEELLPLQGWSGIPQQVLHQVDVAINLWDPSGRSGVVERENEKDNVIAGWLAVRAIGDRDWPKLLRLAKTQNNRYWQALAETFLSSKAVFPVSNCIKWARRASPDSAGARACGDTMFKNLIGWIKNDQAGGESAAFREAFVRQYLSLLLDRRVSQLNYVNGLCWDASSAFPQGPLLSELYLNYPENRKYWAQLQDRLKAVSATGDIFQ